MEQLPDQVYEATEEELRAMSYRMLMAHRVYGFSFYWIPVVNRRKR